VGDQEAWEQLDPETRERLAFAEDLFTVQERDEPLTLAQTLAIGEALRQAQEPPS
jgi:hypothetical protein